MRKVLLPAVSLLVLWGVAAGAADSLVTFDGGIGVIPVSRVAGEANATTGNFPDVVRNDVRGVPPGGQPWVISRLRADVKLDGRISVDGRGLLLAGGNGIGTTASQMVRARLVCGAVAHDSDLVQLAPNGYFRIDDILSPVPPITCATPVLLIVSGNGNWFAAGIPKD
jgi:hypothetical protein